jgi:hypothetical protein
MRGPCRQYSPLGVAIPVSLHKLRNKDGLWGVAGPAAPWFGWAPAFTNIPRNAGCGPPGLARNPVGAPQGPTRPGSALSGSNPGSRVRGFTANAGRQAPAAKGPLRKPNGGIRARYSAQSTVTDSPDSPDLVALGHLVRGVAGRTHLEAAERDGRRNVDDERQDQDPEREGGSLDPNHVPKVRRQRGRALRLLTIHTKAPEDRVPSPSRRPLVDDATANPYRHLCVFSQVDHRYIRTLREPPQPPGTRGAGCRWQHRSVSAGAGRRWRRKTSVRSNPTASWPPYEKYTFLRGTDAPMERRDLVFIVAVLVGIFLVAGIVAVVAVLVGLV